MDFTKLSRMLPAAGQGTNGTEPLTLTELPPNILDALVPGYSLVSRYVLATSGIDISMFVSLLAVIFGALKAAQYLLAQFEKVARQLVISTVYIEDSDDLFDQVMAWLSHRQGLVNRRSVQAKTMKGSNWEDPSDEAVDDALDDDGMFDYNKWAARTPPRYEPWYGKSLIWHNGRLMILRKSQRHANRMTVALGNRKEEDQLQIDCVGLSVQPIKDLLRTIKIWSLSRERNTTTIRHPTPKDRARFGGSWSKTSSRPSRPMDTVILDALQKDMIIKDMNEYLHPLSPRWYATRGIPYRRGYLFHGPPGTGKTSLSFALGGIFGLDIYAISLQEPALTEGDLMQLFNGLPKRCIVLLEDVDAAGLIRDETSDNSNRRKKQESKTDDTETVKDGQTSAKDQSGIKRRNESDSIKDVLKELTKELKSAGAQNQRQNQRVAAKGQTSKSSDTGISLSGLLNAIDGVATHEGRVLIMTTNHPEQLDAALVRPGRVDRKVEFRLAMREQARELFLRMYAISEKMSLTGPKADGRARVEASNGRPVNGSYSSEDKAKDEMMDDDEDDEDQLASMTVTELEELAAEFAAQIPDGQYTPAEIQNLLMRYKKQPRKAVSKVDGWKEEVAAEKESLQQGTAEPDADDEVGNGE